MGPYTARICGREATAKGWDNDGNLCLEDGRRFTFLPLSEPAFSVLDAKLSEVAELRRQDGEWLVNDKPLSEALRLAESAMPSLANRSLADCLDEDCSPEFVRLYRLEKVLGECREPGKVVGVAWFQGNDMNLGEDSPVLLASFAGIVGPDEAGSQLAQAKAIQATAEILTKATTENLEKIHRYWPNTPAAADARRHILSNGVPEGFLDWVMSQRDLNGRWPRGDASLRQCQQKGWKGKRGGVSPATVNRWLHTIRTKREKAGLETPRGQDAMQHIAESYRIDD